MYHLLHEKEREARAIALPPVMIWLCELDCHYGWLGREIVVHLSAVQEEIINGVLAAGETTFCQIKIDSGIVVWTRQLDNM